MACLTIHGHSHVRNIRLAAGMDGLIDQLLEKAEPWLKLELMSLSPELCEGAEAEAWRLSVTQLMCQRMFERLYSESPVNGDVTLASLLEYALCCRLSGGSAHELPKV